MRKIIVSNLISIDGFFAGPNGEIDWHNYDEEMGENSKALMQSLGTIIFGHTTYELMKSYWPTPEGIESEPLVAEIMNSIPKIVFSKSMSEAGEDATWKNITVLKEIRPEEIIQMKEQAGKDMVILGSGTIVEQFANLGLIDEYRLIVNPVVLAHGKPLFKDIQNKFNLTLVNTKIFKNGNVLLCYQPVRR